MSAVPEYTKRAIKKYHKEKQQIIKEQKHIYYLQNAEELKRKRRERYQQQKLVCAN